MPITSSKQNQNYLTLAYGQKLVRFLAHHKNAISPLLILTHDYPDPDALAGACALQFLTEKVFGINSRVVYRGIIGRMENRSMVHILRLPVHKLRSNDLKKYDHIALIDTQPEFENNPFPDKKRATIVIDQHPSLNRPLADLIIVDTECGATCVILAQAILSLKIKIPEEIATSLAYGILTDTLNFYRAHRPDIVNAYLGILPFCNMRSLARIQTPFQSRKFFTTLGQGIQQAMIRRGLIMAHLGEVDSPDLVSQIADFLLTYKQAQWSLATGRFKDRLHVSLRTVKEDVPAAKILRDVFPNPEDAGGHDVIAGGSLKIPRGAEESVWEQTEQSLIARLVKRLRIPKKSEFYCPFRTNGSLRNKEESK